MTTIAKIYNLEFYTSVLVYYLLLKGKYLHVELALKVLMVIGQPNQYM